MTKQYQVAKGSILLPAPKDVKKSRRRLHTKYARPGDVLPDGALEQSDIDRLLADGYLIEVSGDSEKPEPHERRVQRRGKWSLNPELLQGKSLEDLLMLVVEVDPDFKLDTLCTEADAIKQLSKDFDPEFEEVASQASDKTLPHLPRSHDAERGPVGEAAPRKPSDKARAAIERARKGAKGE